MALSAFASESMENVIAEGSGNPYIMQVTFFRDLELTRKIITRAEGLSSRNPVDFCSDRSAAFSSLYYAILTNA